MKKHIKEILEGLPHSSGVYRFYDKKGENIYIGKSKNLKSRVSSYFNSQQKLNFAKKKMVSYIEDIQYIVTNNETESLILENDLVKQYQPKYNILLKDDKNFLYIKVTKEEYPQIVRTRISPSRMRVSDGKYYGPYISGYHVFQILKILKKIYGYGVGNHNFFKRRGTYNLDKYIFEGNIDAEAEEQKKVYQEKIKSMMQFLSGDTSYVKSILREEMIAFAEKREFEEAQKRKNSLEALESLDTYQYVRDGVKGEYIVIQILEKYEKMYVGIIDIIDSKISGYENYEVDNTLSDSSDEILRSFIETKWTENRERKKLSFIAPREYPELTELGIKVETPQLGPKFELLKLCYKNLYEYAHKKHLDSLSTKSFSKKTMQNLLELLGYTEINSELVFECNDISHLSGTHTVASRSVIEGGKKNGKKYRKFRIKTLEDGKIDDFGSMREIMTRRILELEKLGNFPDLIVIDGGKGQLGSVMEIIENSDFLKSSEIPLQIVSIAKREEELFLPGQSESILLDKDSAELRLIQAIRDEAHRFAITFNRDSRVKAERKNILESVPGIGPKTRKKIFSNFGSVNGLKKVSRGELEKVLGKSVTENLENHGIIS